MIILKFENHEFSAQTNEEAIKYLMSMEPELKRRLPVVDMQQVSEHKQDLYNTAESLMIKLLPPEQYGEDDDAKELYSIIKELAGQPETQSWEHLNREALVKEAHNILVFIASNPKMNHLERFTCLNTIIKKINQPWK